MTSKETQLPRRPVEKAVDVAQAGASLAEIVKNVARGEVRVILKDGDQPMAVVVSASDFERLTRIEDARALDLSVLEASQAAFEDLSEDELEAQIAKAIADVRAGSRGPARNRSKPA